MKIFTMSHLLFFLVLLVIANPEAPSKGSIERPFRTIKNLNIHSPDVIPGVTGSAKRLNSGGISQNIPGQWTEPHFRDHVIETPYLGGVDYEVGEQYMIPYFHKQYPNRVSSGPEFPYVIEKPVAVGVAAPYQVEFQVLVPTPFEVQVPLTVPVKVPYPIEYAVSVAVPQPYEFEVAMLVPVPYEVEVYVPNPVEVPVPFPVEVPKMKEVSHPHEVYVNYDVPLPYEVEAPVPIPYEVDINVPFPVLYPVEVLVEVPFDVYVPYEAPVELYVPVPEPLEVLVPIKHPYPVEVIVDIPVPQPYEVIVPVIQEIPLEYPVQSDFDLSRVDNSHYDMFGERTIDGSIAHNIDTIPKGSVVDHRHRYGSADIPRIHRYSHRYGFVNDYFDTYRPQIPYNDRTPYFWNNLDIVRPQIIYNPIYDSSDSNIGDGNFVAFNGFDPWY